MFFLYNILTHIAGLSLGVIALFNNKIRLFIDGRKPVFEELKSKISPNDKVVWFHTASLGEFEQGLPVIEKVKKEYPEYKVIVTFFSPSGYEVKKNSRAADIITYLPLDTKKNVIRFLDSINPVLAVFVKYEFWPNYLNELKKRNINTILISAIFRPDQAFFKPYGSFFRKSLEAFNHFFVQDENSEQLLKSININNTTVCGDTRLDRVYEILERDNNLTFIKDFKDDKLCLVAGSTWPEDEELLVEYINNCKYNYKFIIAPHNIKPATIHNLKSSIAQKTVLYSEMKNEKLNDFSVFIIDTIGLLTKIYSYADIAYVGGGMGSTGLHNTLEPAVFGIPVVIGKEYKKFREAVDLIDKGGMISVQDFSTLKAVLDKFFQNNSIRKTSGSKNQTYITQNRGANMVIFNYISEQL